MSRISHFSRNDHQLLQEKISTGISTCSTLEEAAQSYMTYLYEMFEESIVLTRLFATTPFHDLPQTNQSFVKNLAESSGLPDSLHDETLVLSLLGSRGVRPEWNDRRQSSGHIGIPLLSSQFVDQIPMISRLLKELGAGLDWIDSKETGIVSRTFGSLSGVFHVGDAATELDNQSRNIIPAQDFVRSEGVKTVFGFGGCYMGSSLFFVIVLFLREFVEKTIAERFMLQANFFKANTLQLIDNGAIFS